MKNDPSTSLKTGNSTAECIAILAILIVIILVAPKGVSISTPNSNNFSISTNPGGESATTAPDSSYARDISLGTGNATYAYQAYEEYVTIGNRGRNPVNITNWYLKNAKDKRAYNLGGELRYFKADTATIGQAALFVSPGGHNTFQDVVLQRGENAIITTGSVGSQLPYKIVSFKENICSGYLENLPEYVFTPQLTTNCPRPIEEPGVDRLDTGCRKFIERMPSCHTPEFDTRDSEGEICRNCVDGKLLSSSCVLFIKNHFNYGSCLSNHGNDQNFSGRTWRIFLGRGWEMWAKEFETIELFDQFGRLVTSRTY